MNSGPKRAGTPRIFAAFIDVAAAGFLTCWVESLGRGAETYSVFGVAVGLLYLASKDSFSGTSVGKMLTGCVLIDAATGSPVDATMAFRRNGRLFGAVGGILLFSFAVGSLAGEVIGTLLGAFGLIAAFVYFADKIDSWDGTMVVLRRTIPTTPTGPPPEDGPNQETRGPKPKPVPPPEYQDAEPQRHAPANADDVELSQSEMLALLCISMPFTMADLKKAYRRTIAEYHPDRVAHLAREFQQIAEQRSKQINFAYSKLRSYAAE